MIIFKSVQQISSYLKQKKAEGNQVGFVPTMGALHAGHMALLQKAKEENDLSVCSIFVNPTQFTNPEDFKHYPVTIEQDIEQLTDAGCHLLFLPPEKEIYPDNYRTRSYDLGPLETILEGYYRPGHFQGVCGVVDRLLDIVRPNSLYMGQKDYQQTKVIARLLELIRSTVILKTVPTLREKSGLAMSSRNLRLSNELRERATLIYKVLTNVKESFRHQMTADVLTGAATLLRNKGFEVDYVTVRNAETLEEYSGKYTPAIALIAATVGGIRLIDNMLLN